MNDSFLLLNYVYIVLCVYFFVLIEYCINGFLKSYVWWLGKIVNFFLLFFFIIGLRLVSLFKDGRNLELRR